MTIRELILDLQKYNQELEIVATWEGQRKTIESDQISYYETDNEVIIDVE